MFCGWWVPDTHFRAYVAIGIQAVSFSLLLILTLFLGAVTHLPGLLVQVALSSHIGPDLEILACLFASTTVNRNHVGQVDQNRHCQ